jgi:GH35 family endo-1,4-beta-xylanase
MKNHGLLLVVLSTILSSCGSSQAAPSPPPSPPVAADPDPLKDAAQASGKWVGSAVQSSLLRSDALYASTCARHFNYLTPENEMKWGSIERQPGSPDYSPADSIVAFAEARGMRVKGHALVWHQQVPDWVTRLSTPELRIAFEDHIRSVAGRFRGRVVAWDVVNEAVAEDGSGLRDSLFLQKLGPGYLADAFRLAHEADPQALLFYNDYGAEGLGRKSDRVYELVRSLLAGGVPIHGVGLQMHVEAGTAPSAGEVAQNMRRLADLGLLVNISEMDVQIRRLPGDRASRFEAQRRVYHDLVGACVGEPRCQSVTFWGFTDAHSWIDSFFGADDPLPFDESYQAKPAFFGIQDAFLRR